MHDEKNKGFERKHSFIPFIEKTPEQRKEDERRLREALTIAENLGRQMARELSLIGVKLMLIMDFQTPDRWTVTLCDTEDLPFTGETLQGDSGAQE